MNALKHYLLWLGLAFSFTILMSSSCGKQPDTLATITVLDSDSGPVSSATVHVYSSTGDRFDMEATTNSRGEVMFNFNEFYERGQSGLAVLDLEVTDGTNVFNDIIKIEGETNNLKTVQFP